MERANTEQVDLFLERIQDWIKSSRVIEPRFDVTAVEEILNLDFEELRSKDCQYLIAGAYILYGYTEHLQKIYNQEKYIHEFADNSIWYIIAPVFDNYGDGWVKWQIKYNLAVKENPLANHLLLLKNNCQARITSVENRVELARKKADILLELARRK